jgi:adiponectin receptor
MSGVIAPASSSGDESLDPEEAGVDVCDDENSSNDRVLSEGQGTLIAASLHKISETVKTRLGEKVGRLEAKIERKVEEIEKIGHWAWKSLPFDKLPLWMQDNKYLTHEHRPPMNSFRGCFKSMFRMHTETWNIWTHFIGFIFFVALCLGIYVYGDYITFLFEDVEVYKLPATEQGMLFCFFFGAMICLSCSTMFHLFQNHSYGVYRLFSCLDYSGIAILITGSSIPAYHYGFYCQLTARYTHIAIIGLLCVACVVISLWKKFSTPKYRPLRFATFLLFGLYGFVPGVHVALREGFEKQHTVRAMIGLLIMGGVYVIGAVIYVVRFPERFFPGKFNTWASSHQLFHICVVCAALVHYDTLLNMIKYRLSTDSCALELIHTLPNLDFATA